MAAAGRAMDLGALHPEAVVRRGFDAARDRFVEARPAGAALELAERLEQSRAAAGAGELARPLFGQQGAASGVLRPVLAHDVILLGRQELAPFGVASRDGIGLVHRSVP